MSLTMTTVDLPSATGRSRVLELAEPAQLAVATAPPTSRVAFAAGHVVADPLRSTAGSPAAVDSDATLRIRHSLWDLGLGVAESMDTAQRGWVWMPRPLWNSPAVPSPKPAVATA